MSFLKHHSNYDGRIKIVTDLTKLPKQYFVRNINNY